MLANFVATFNFLKKIYRESYNSALKKRHVKDLIVAVFRDDWFPYFDHFRLQE